MAVTKDRKNIEAQVLGNRQEGNKLVLAKFMQTLPSNSLNNILATLILKTNHKASLLCDQTIVFCYRKQTSGLTAEHLLILRDYTHVRCRGRSLVLREDAQL